MQSIFEYWRQLRSKIFTGAALKIKYLNLNRRAPPVARISGIKELYLKSNELRQDVIRMLDSAKSGHTAGPLGMADIFAALYFNILNHDPKQPNWGKRDLFYLSNGHICPIWYAALAHAGYFPRSELLTFRKINSRLQGHPHRGELPGVENSGGPLSQGISIAVGAAIAAKMDKLSRTIYVGMSDGECEEGQTWEAFMMAGNRKLDNLIAVQDRNNIQIDGFTSDIMSIEPFEQKMQSFNWNTIVIDGNNMAEVLKAFGEAKRTKGRPTMIIAKTIPGKGVSFMENDYKWHGKPPKHEEAEKALKELEAEKERIRTS